MAPIEKSLVGQLYKWRKEDLISTEPNYDIYLQLVAFYKIQDFFNESNYYRNPYVVCMVEISDIYMRHAREVTVFGRTEEGGKRVNKESVIIVYTERLS